MRPALIYNPHSQRNRRAAELKIAGGVAYAAPQTIGELQAVLSGFAAAGVDLLIVCGGDGTLREVVSALPQAYGDRPPALSLLAAGNANLVGADVGTAGYGQSAFDALLEAAQRQKFARRERRVCLRASWPDAGRSPVLGFFGGAAVFNEATRHANEQVVGRGVTHTASVAVTIATGLWRAGGGQKGWLGAERMAITIDGAEPQVGARFIVLVTSLHRLMLGVWPFWGDEGSSAALRYLDIDSPPAALRRSLWALLRGRPTARMLAGGYRSGRAETIRLVSAEPVVIDGESFAPGASGIVEFARGPELEFLSP